MTLHTTTSTRCCHRAETATAFSTWSFSELMNEVLDLIRQLSRERFYGALTLKFEAGRIAIIKKEQTLKLSELPGQPEKRDG
jgi:hypothetical protein